MCRRRNAKGKQVAVRKLDGHLSLFVLPCSVLFVLHSSVVDFDVFLGKSRCPSILLNLESPSHYNQFSKEEPVKSVVFHHTIPI